jgi:hypothetical protein
VLTARLSDVQGGVELNAYSAKDLNASAMLAEAERLVLLTKQ